jgi:hypothetical protein
MPTVHFAKVQVFSQVVFLRDHGSGTEAFFETCEIENSWSRKPRAGTVFFSFSKCDGSLFFTLFLHFVSFLSLLTIIWYVVKGIDEAKREMERKSFSYPSLFVYLFECFKRKMQYRQMQIKKKAISSGAKSNLFLSLQRKRENGGNIFFRVFLLLSLSRLVGI